jgi:hypothetical protein
MSLMVKVAERVIETVSKATEPMLISENPNLISPAPNLISPAPTYFEALPVIGLFIVFAVVVGLSIVLWRNQQVRRYAHGLHQ